MALPTARAVAATQSSPTVSPVPASIPNAGFVLKSWNVTVEGYGTARIVAKSRGKALAQAWRSDAFASISFGDFLKIASAWRAMFADADFGASIEVEGAPAFFVGRNRAYVQFVRPGSDVVVSAHPYEVMPQRFRPEGYRAIAIEARQGRDATRLDAKHESAAIAQPQSPTPKGLSTGGGK